MPFDHDEDDEWPAPDPYPSPDDRLWRHPSELGPGRLPAPLGPSSLASAEPPGHGRAVVAGAVLVGAVLMFGAMWLTRPTRVVERQGATAPHDPVPTRPAAFSQQGLSPSELVDAVGPSVARIAVAHGGTWTTLSGLWVDDRGTLVTAAGPVAAADEVMVVGDDGARQRAEVAGTDPDTGLTTLVAPRTAGRPVDVTTRRPVTGSAVAVVGCGKADAGVDNGDATVATAVVRSVSERATLGRTVLHDALQLDRPVPGDAVGGAVVDPAGTVVGLVIGNSDDRDLATVTPADVLIDTATALRTDGTVSRAWLGVRAVDLDPARSTLLRVAGGALLTEITAGSPAATAGLEPGDVVTAIGRRDVDDASDLVVALRAYARGSRATITFRRGTDVQTVVATLG